MHTVFLMASNTNNNEKGLVRALAPGGRYPNSLWQLVAGLLFLVSLAYFAVRGPARAGSRLVDFPTFYSATRAWILGDNPYLESRLKQTFEKAGGPPQQLVDSLNVPVIYPLLLPLAVLPYPAAKWTLVIGNIAFLALGLYYLARFADLGWREPRTHLFLILGTSLASFHTSISQGQVTIAITLCLICMMKLDVEGRDRRAGVLLAIAGALKPQMVLAFGAYYLLRRRWQIVMPALLTSTALVVLSVGRMEIAGVPWFEQLRENLVQFSYGGEGDPTVGIGRYLKMSLHVVLHTVIENRTVVNILVAAFGIGFFGALLAGDRGGIRITGHQQAASKRELLLIYSCLAVVAPLLLYSRFYTATLVIFPLAWALSSIRPGFVKIPLACLVSISPFLLPGVAMLIRGSNGALGSIADTWWWMHVLLPHQIYSLLALVLLLIAALRFCPEAKSPSSQIESHPRIRRLGSLRQHALFLRRSRTKKSAARHTGI